MFLERSDPALTEPGAALAVLSRVSLSPRVTQGQESGTETQSPQVRLLGAALAVPWRSVQTGICLQAGTTPGWHTGRLWGHSTPRPNMEMNAAPCGI